MRTFRNPFRARTSEQLGDPLVFLRNFGASVVEMLSDDVWDRPLLLRSAAGGGKTTLMRLFTIETLSALHRRREEFPQLAEQLERIGALSPEGPTHLGVLLNLDGDYRSLLDLGLTPDRILREFHRLLDARIMLSVLRAALTSVGSDDLTDLRLVPLAALSDAEALAEPLGGLSGPSLWERARANERAVLRPLDALLPDDEAHDVDPPPTRLLSLRLLSLTRLEISGKEIPLRPLVMFDDGHGLAPAQRQALLPTLGERSLDVARWYAERFEALSADDLLIGSTEGRDFLLVELENAVRAAKRGESLLLDVATRRARPYLQDYGGVEQTFTDLIRVDESQMLGPEPDEVMAELWRRVLELAGDDPLYAIWLEEVRGLVGYRGAVERRALEIIIASDLERRQDPLFVQPLPLEEFERRRSRISAVAPFFLARDLRLPYYAGPQRFAQLGSENMDQFLRLAGDLFEEMLAELTVNRGVPRLTARQQDRIAHRASERYWREIPRRVRHAAAVRRLIAAIVELAQADTFRPTAPYAPGVTGTALPMPDRERLLDPAEREKLPGAQELFDAIAAAVENNVLSIQLDYAVKNQRVMVIYLNRLLCPRFGLPLGRGGFRERRLDTMVGWMTGELRGDADENLEVHETGQLTL